MKTDYLVRFKNKLIFQIALTVLASVVVLLFIWFLIDGILNDILANTVSGISRKLYLFIVNHKVESLFALFSFIIVTTIYFTVSRTIGYFNSIIRSIDKVFSRDEGLITLPGEFKDIENKLNSIKYDALKNEQIAKEAEQRKNDLVVYLAHDLKTPLTSVIGYLSLLRDEKGISEELREKYLSISLDKSQRLEDLINEFFEITRFNLQNIRLENKRINLTHMLEQIAEEFYPLLTPKELKLELKLEPGIFIMGDPDKLARVFDNLLRNAISYSYPRSIITLAVAREKTGVAIRFRNKGDIIPEHRLESIFEKFYRLDESRSSQTGGAGLGLAIAREIVELHRGSITASSSMEYTEFLILLP